MNIATGTIWSSEHLARYSCFPVLAESSTRSICISSAISASLSRSLSQLSSLSHSSSPSSSSSPSPCSRGSLILTLHTPTTKSITNFEGADSSPHPHARLKYTAASGAGAGHLGDTPAYHVLVFKLRFHVCAADGFASWAVAQAACLMAFRSRRPRSRLRAAHRCSRGRPIGLGRTRLRSTAHSEEVP